MNTQAEVSTRELPLAKLAHLPAEDLRILADIKRALVRTIGNRPHRIVLFGSKARGDYGRRSDLDVAVIVDGLDSTLRNAIYDAVGMVELEHSVFTTTFAISTEAFERLRARERRIALDIEREGIPL
jgi:hypothetical protein